MYLYGGLCSTYTNSIYIPLPTNILFNERIKSPNSFRTSLNSKMEDARKSFI